MEKNQNIYDYILGLCAGTRKEICTPSIKNGKVYSTNSFLIVRMPAEKPNGPYQENTINTDFGSVYTKVETTCDKTITMKTQELLGIVNQYGMHVDKFSECPACTGQGEEECFHCGSFTDCKTCDGAGKHGDKNIMHMFKFKENAIEFDGIGFTTEYLHILAVIAAVLGEEELSMEITGRKASVTFEKGEVELVLMTHNH